MLRSVKLEDAFVDQLLELKQLGWVARNAGGDASVMVSNALGGLPLPPDPLLKYTANVAKVDTAWGSLDELAAGPAGAAALRGGDGEGEAGIFRGRLSSRCATRTLKMLIAGEKPEMTTTQWTAMIGRASLAPLLGVAEVALDIAKDYAAEQRARDHAAPVVAARALLAPPSLLAIGMMSGRHAARHRAAARDPERRCASSRAAT